MSNKKLYIGVDPDLRNLNVALLLSDGGKHILLAVFLRRNKSPRTGDGAVADAVAVASELVNDVVSFMVQHEQYQGIPITMVAESQSMQHAVQANRHAAHYKINYDDILHLGQVVGIILGAFGEMAGGIHLVSAMKWKGNTPKLIHHDRLYAKLGWIDYPYHLGEYSGDKINPGDFMDINDSIGLALYGAEHNL